MNYRMLLTGTLLLLVITGFHCKRSNAQPILTGRLVIENGCMYSAVEILDGQYAPSRVLASWKDPDNDSVYTNVFAIGGVRNFCDIRGYGISKGDVFTFQMDPDPQHFICNDCNVTHVPSLPSVSNAIMNIKLVSSH